MAKPGRICVVVADITTLDVGVIVNAANSDLVRGAGVCGAIFRAAGDELDAACAAVAPCPIGESRLTRGFNSRARWIVHSVGPVWRGGDDREDELLASAYRSALKIGVFVEATSMAFPAISTGSYGFPFERAANIAIAIVQDWVRTHDHPSEIIFSLLHAVAANIYGRSLRFPYRY